MSSSYHPQTDGQTEVVNRRVETYLRCFCSEQPKLWFSWLHRAKWWYNTTFQVSLDTTPFQVVYGRRPPSLVHYVVGSSGVDAVDMVLGDRDEALRQLKF